MHWQQQECSSCSFVLQILCNDTEANYFYGNMCTHIHISLILWCLYCYELSSLSFHSYHLHEVEIIFCLAISRMNCTFHHICLWYVQSYVCIFVIFLIFSYFFICHLLMQNISFFPFLFVHFLRKFKVNYIDELYTDISFIIVSYFVYTFYYTHVLLFHEIFSVFQLTFFAVIIMSICTHSHSSAKHW